MHLFTSLLITNSAQKRLMSLPPPIKKDILPLATMVKAGDATVPCGPSSWNNPAGKLGLGRFSKLAIHQSLC